MLERALAAYVKRAFEKGAGYRCRVDRIDGIYDLSYCEDHDAMHRLDVYFPKKSEIKAYPIIFNIHGGAWVAFEKLHNRAYCEYLSSFGYCVVNMSYRLLPKVDVIGQLQDIAMGIQYIMDNDFAVLDKEKIVFMGDSAGAHLISVLYCIMMQEDRQELFHIRMQKLPIKAMILQNTVSDLSAFSNSKRLSYTLLMKLLFKRKWKSSPYLHKTSFLELVNEDTPKIPIFLVGSEQDPLYKQTQRMQRYLEKHHWQWESKIWRKTDREGLGHVFQVSHPEWKESKETHEQIFTFLKEVLMEKDRDEELKGKVT